MIGQELLNVPMGDMIKQMAFAIAEAQIQLDANSIEVAQMMGGLQTIYREDGSVAFTDSRVFFGKEKVPLVDAFNMHNSTNDIELRVRIRSAIGDGNYDFDVTKINKTYSTMTTDKDAYTEGNYYYSTNDKKYYRFDYSESPTPTTKVNYFTEVSEFQLPIFKKGTSFPEYVYVDSRVSMLELGFSPTFYQFVDTIIEVKIDIRMTKESERTTSRTHEDKFEATTKNTRNSSSNVSVSARGGFILNKVGFSAGSSSSSSRESSTARVSTNTVNSTYKQKYSYSEEGSSLLRTKLVPIPPPTILEERIRAIMEVAKEAGVDKNIKTDSPPEGDA